ncbi:hypothetical protein [Microtetraspora malaysiensis]|uniref:hypothetical protein n=1 Tax=Microtetraspora malaysiensis TaxID=161358 RepID=UPI003D9138CD
MRHEEAVEKDEKQRQLDQHRVDLQGTRLTTDQGVLIDDTDNSLQAGERGPTVHRHYDRDVAMFSA